MDCETLIQGLPAAGIRTGASFSWTFLGIVAVAAVLIVLFGAGSVRTGRHRDEQPLPPASAS